jgi:hypothetical protein
MSFKTEEEVRRRRGKNSKRKGLNFYQKLVLLAGALSLLLTIGVGHKMAPIVSVGVIGGTLLLFFLLKRRSPKTWSSKKVGSKEISTQEKEVEPQEEILPAEKGVVPEVYEVFPQEEKTVNFHEGLPEEQEIRTEPRAILADEKGIYQEAFAAEGQASHSGESPEVEKVIDFDEKLSEGREKMAELQAILAEEKGIDRGDFPVKEKITHLEEVAFRLEEKVAEMQDMLLKLEEKVAASQEMSLKSEQKVDLQRILSNFDERQERLL